MFDDDSKKGTPENGQNQDQPNERQTPPTEADERLAQNGGEHADAEDAEQAGNAETSDDKKLGKVIPFDAAAQANLEVIAAKEALDDAVRNLKTAFGDIKTQFAPLIASIKDTAETIRKSRLADKPDPSSAPSGETPAEDIKPEQTAAEKPKTEQFSVELSRETTEAITQGIQKLKSRMTPENLNLKGILSDEFEAYADRRLTDADYTVDDDGNRVVKIDGAFMHAHGNDMIPELLRGTLGTFLRNILGSNVVAIETDASGDKSETQDQTADAEHKSEENSKYRIKFDFADTLSEIIQNAKIVPKEGEAPIDAEALDRSKAIVIEGTKMTEDALNGIPVTDAAQRLEKAVEEADKKRDPDYQSPEDIEAMNEKHRKILEMAKDFERSMSKDGDKTP